MMLSMSTRLGQVLDGPSFHRIDRRGDAGVTGEHEDTRPGLASSRGADGFRPDSPPMLRSSTMNSRARGRGRLRRASLSVAP